MTLGAQGSEHSTMQGTGVLRAADLHVIHVMAGRRQLAVERSVLRCFMSKFQRVFVIVLPMERAIEDTAAFSSLLAFLGDVAGSVGK